MSSRKFLAAALLLALAAPLGACGFQPVYASKEYRNDNSMASEAIAKVKILPLKNRDGQKLQNLLIDRMYQTGYPKQPTHTVEVIPYSDERQLGIQKDAVATRAELEMTATVILRETATAKEVYRTTVRTRVSYNILDAQYATLVARENATDRGLEQIADDVVTRLSLYFTRDASDADASPNKQP